MRIFAAGLTLGLGLAVASAPALADQTDRATFGLSLRGISAGTLTVNGSITGGKYQAEGVFQSAGIVGALRKIRYDARSNGTYRNGKFVPAVYWEKADTPKRQSEVTMGYRGGVPQGLTFDPPKEADGKIKLSSQGGTYDPLTALYAVLRDVPAEAACKTAFNTFDGKRAARVTLTNPTAAGDTVTCNGEYRRVAGFSANDMAEKTSFPFALSYKKAANGMMRVEEISLDTVYGKGALKRR
ncbi:DUF3108 domain-containing protein [Albirhodobacter sp. R86504]|jgi:hypothetical protein|uniref:DUF3108 domain-containing protein n=1 Tax=Albirhodobacter sp. R86504 TaxID=3093848 RepID=UPI00366C5FFE